MPLITIVSLLFFSIQYLCAKSDWFLALGLGPCWLLSSCWLRRDPHNCSNFGIIKCRSGTDVSSFLAICWIRLSFCPVSFVFHLSVPWFTASDYPFDISNFHKFAVILNSLVLYLSSNNIIFIKFDF